MTILKKTRAMGSNAAKQAKKFGDTNLAKICGIISSDEKRHEEAYTKITKKLFDVDPDTTMLSFAYMMGKNITMPGSLMFDGEDKKLFHHFSSMAQRMGMYTAIDYVDVLEFLITRWNVDKATANASPPVPFSWIFNRLV
ncbi:hypothetical protein AAC387_Pa01g2883 [Persea americana]